MSQINTESISKIIQRGGVGVIPTDTLYGIVGSALIPETVEKIYDLRKRNKTKPMIILIASISELSKFKINPDEKLTEKLLKLWPNPISIILPNNANQFSYLDRGTKSLAFRMPNKKWLLKLLKLTGPLVAPSANFEGEEESKTISEAKEYFDDSVDFYVDGGVLETKPSTLIRIKNENIEILRQGDYILKNE